MGKWGLLGVAGMIITNSCGSPKIPDLNEAPESWGVFSQDPKVIQDDPKGFCAQILSYTSMIGCLGQAGCGKGICGSLHGPLKNV